MRLFYSTIALVILCLLGNNVATAQAPKEPKITPIAKFKPPMAKTYLAKFSGINAVCTAEVGKQIITLPLRIADDKNNTFKISSYQFAYKRVGITEDEEGKTSPQTDMVADRFTATPLPATWLKRIGEDLHKGEQLYFFDIIVLDKNSRLFFAPDLKITIE